MSSSDSGSDSDVPESFSLAQAKKSAQTQDKVLKQAQADEKHRKKEKNRARDRGLKERAESRKGGSAEEDVVSRMERAMLDAGEEDSGEEDELEMMIEGADEDEDEDGSDEDSEESDEDEDKDMESAEESEEEEDDMVSEESSEQEEDLTSSTQNRNHLPEHLFASTSASTAKQNELLASRKKLAHRKEIKKRRPHRTKPKDLVLGSVLSSFVSSIIETDLPLDLGQSVRFLQVHPDQHLGIPFQMSHLLYEPADSRIGALA